MSSDALARETSIGVEPDDLTALDDLSAATGAGQVSPRAEAPTVTYLRRERPLGTPRGDRLRTGRTQRVVNIMGTRGYPAAHGGFETFVSRLAPYLKQHGWGVRVYCQNAVGKDDPRGVREDVVDGVERHIVDTVDESPFASAVFDWHATLDAMKQPGIDIVFGYNTAIFSALLRLRGRKMLMNMDGVEWKRAKWSLPFKSWFYLNELVGSHIASVPIADHPEIARHLRRHGCFRAVTIPYGADEVRSAPTATLDRLGIERGRYFITIARIEPENSLLEIVRAFSRERRPIKLVVLGLIDKRRTYHQAVLEAASEDVIFPGPIYEKEAVGALRFHSMAYLHGHQVGGTNPSLVEALGAGSAVVAHDNVFNRWVAGPEQSYFATEAELAARIEQVAADPCLLTPAREAARRRHAQSFRWGVVLEQYRQLLEAQL